MIQNLIKCGFIFFYCSSWQSTYHQFRPLLHNWMKVLKWKSYSPSIYNVDMGKCGVGGGEEAIYLKPKWHWALNGVNERHKESLTLSQVNVLLKYRLQHQITFIINTSISPGPYSTYCQEGRVSKLRASSNAFIIIWCTMAGSEGLHGVYELY
jgi:hypothetical protein